VIRFLRCLTHEFITSVHRQREPPAAAWMELRLSVEPKAVAKPWMAVSTR
jgi:hypothetical protein